jgi:predicted anti-sigma-YlaC factor YlaD
MSSPIKHDPALIRLIEEQLGRDASAELIAEVAQHMAECPDCRIFVDTVRQTIKIYRVTETEQSVPSDVSDRLFKVLKLDRGLNP